MRKIHKELHLLVMLGVVVLVSFFVARTRSVQAEESRPEAAGPADTRPAWLKDGLVATQSVEPLLFVIRRGGGVANPLERRGEELSEETIRKWKEAGVNLILRSLYMGAGLQAEAEDIAAVRKFVQLANRHGVKVGGYVGGSLLYETLFLEEPEARDWRQVDEWGRPCYYSTQTFRYMACRNNPGYQAHIRKVLRLGIQDLKLDFIHFDHLRWPAEPRTCRCKYCAEEFRKFLRHRYTDPQLTLRFGFIGVDGIIPPPYNLLDPPIRLEELRNPLMQDWADFRAASLAQRWRELVDYIRELNPEVAVQGNATMYLHTNTGFSHGVDPSLLFEYGDYLRTEEPNQAEWTADGRLVSLIRPYKAARVMGKALNVLQVAKSELDWQARPGVERWRSPIELRLAEAMAYNDMCLGTFRRNLADATTAARQYVSFFHAHKAELRDTTTVADVAILRSFPSIEFNPSQSLFSTVLFEQSLIQGKVPFAIIFDRHLKELSKYKALVLANQDALSDEQVQTIRRYVAAGGGLVATEETSLLTDWRRRRPKFGLADLFGINEPPSRKQASQSLRREYGEGRVAYIPRIEPAIAAPPAQMTYHVGNQYWKLPKNHRDLMDAVRWAAGGELTAEVDAPEWVTIELAQQRGTNRLLLHLLNYKVGEPVLDIPVKLKLPAGMKVKEAVVETPDAGGRQVLSVVANGRTVSFRVPALKIYDLVLLRLEKS